jgi:hypothetical protein
LIIRPFQCATLDIVQLTDQCQWHRADVEIDFSVSVQSDLTWFSPLMVAYWAPPSILVSILRFALRMTASSALSCRSISR